MKSNKRKLLEKAKSQILNMEGIVGIVELDQEQCKSVANLEEKAMKNVLSGLGFGKNEGVKDSLSREIVMVLFTDIKFEIPKDAKIMELVSKGEVMGTSSMNLDKIKEYKKDERYIVLNDFLIINRDADINPSAFASRETYFVLKGVQINQFLKIPEIRDHVLSFPSPPVFDFLKEQFKNMIDFNNPQLAGFLLGFNLQDNFRPYLISCGILKKEIEKMIVNSSLPVEPHFLDVGLHTDYDELESELTRAIEKCSKDNSRGIVVVYGDICHPNMNSIIGKHNNVVKVDALNCIDCLLGGYGRLLEIDPKHEFFYLSPGWMPSNLKTVKRFTPIFDLSREEVRRKFSMLKGIISFDSLGNLDKYKEEIEEFSNHTGLPILDKKTTGINELKNLILEAVENLRNIGLSS